MKCLVTGGEGFIGKHLCEELMARGHEVTPVDIKTGSDITGKKGFGISWDRFDWVFHLAGLADVVPSIERPAAYFETNVLGTLNVLEFARSVGAKRFIYAASSSCYGINNMPPTPEWLIPDPQHPYALTKHMGEELVLHWAQVYGLPSISLRLFNVYGPGQRTTGQYGAVLGTFIAQMLRGEPFTIVGDGNQTRDFVYVKDVVKSFIKAAECDASGEVINIGSGKETSVLKLAHLIGPEYHNSVFIPDRPAEPRVTLADISKARKMLNWIPETTLEEGIAETLKHAEDWRDAPVWTSETIAEATREWFYRLGGKNER